LARFGGQPSVATIIAGSRGTPASTSPPPVWMYGRCGTARRGDHAILDALRLAEPDSTHRFDV
jgi:hypothetical protein